MNEIQIIIAILAMMILLWIIKDIQLTKLEAEVKEMKQVVEILCGAAIRDYDERHRRNESDRKSCQRHLIQNPGGDNEQNNSSCDKMPNL